MFNIGPTELIVILIVALVVFGPKRLPEIGRTIGRSLNEFRRASNDLRRELEVDLKDEPSGGATASPASSDPAPPAPRTDEQASASEVTSADRATAGGPTSSNPQG